LQGWKAIATYLLAAGVTQEILKHLPQFLPDFCQSQGSAGSFAPSPPNPSDRESCRVVHHIPGRIRLSIPRLRQDREYAKAIQRLLEQERDLTGIRLNPSGGTAVITYLAHAFAGGKSRSKTEQLALEAAYFLDRLRSLDKHEDSEAIGGHSRLGSSLNSQPSPQALPASLLDRAVPIAPERDELQDPASPAADEAAADSATDPEDPSAEALAAVEATAIEGSGYWSRFKACMGAMMLKMMANLPLQTATT
jgi:hypothetical protein